MVNWGRVEVEVGGWGNSGELVVGRLEFKIFIYRFLSLGFRLIFGIFLFI